MIGHILYYYDSSVENKCLKIIFILNIFTLKKKEKTRNFDAAGDLSGNNYLKLSRIGPKISIFDLENFSDSLPRTTCAESPPHENHFVL